MLKRVLIALHIPASQESTKEHTLKPTQRLYTTTYNPMHAESPNNPPEIYQGVLEVISETQGILGWRQHAAVSNQLKSSHLTFAPSAHRSRDAPRKGHTHIASPTLRPHTPGFLIHGFEPGGIRRLLKSERPRRPPQPYPKVGGLRPPPFGMVSGAPGAFQTPKIDDLQ